MNDRFCMRLARLIVFVDYGLTIDGCLSDFMYWREPEVKLITENQLAQCPTGERGKKMIGKT